MPPDRDRIDKTVVGIENVDVKKTGYVDLAVLYDLCTSQDDKVSPGEFLRLLLASRTCAIRYKDFLNFLYTGEAFEGTPNPTILEDDGNASPSSASALSHTQSMQTKWGSYTEHPGDKNKPRVLITGATGLLGREIYKTFKRADWAVCGTGLTRAAPPLVQIDLFDTTAFHELLIDFKPKVVIHCVAERQPDKIEGNTAWAMKINSELTGTIARLCRDVGSWLVYVSTNYVFDGKNAPYAENAVTCPANTYGESKKAGEDSLLEELSSGAVLRVPLLYGPTKSIDESSVTQLVKVLKQQDAPKIDHWQERYPTYTGDVAQMLLAFSNIYLKRGSDNPEAFAGIFHWQAPAMHTKYTMAKIIQSITGLQAAQIIPVTTAPPAGSAPRPQFEQMLCTRLENLLGLPSDSDGISKKKDPTLFATDFEQSMRLVLKPLGPFTENPVADPDAY